MQRTKRWYPVILPCWSAVMSLYILAASCSYWPQRAGPVRPSFEQMLAAPYDQTKLKESLTLDVLPRIHRSQGQLAPYFTGAELLSQSESVVASSGQTEDGRRIWFNMVAFDEFRLNAVRKYFFMVDDRNPTLWGKSHRGLRFDCRVVLPEDVGRRSYADQSARQVAILRYILTSLHKDTASLDGRSGAADHDDKTVSVCAMIVNQAFEIILRELEVSPALAMRLGGADGVELNHITFDKGTARMTAAGDTIEIAIRFGTFAPTEKSGR